MTHVSEEQLVAFHFGDTEGRENTAIERHLHECEACRRALAEVQRTIAAVGEMPVPERSESYGTEVWLRLQPKLAESQAAPWWQAVADLLVPKRLAFAGGLAVLVLAAFVAGRYWPSGGTGSPSTPPRAAAARSGAAVPERTPDEVGQKVLLAAVGDHLERSERTLVELVNSSGAHPVDISSEQDRARDLVVANRLFRQTAQSTGHRGLASVLDDLERVLVEVANGPSTLSVGDAAKVRERIESQGILFKVQVLGERVRENLRPSAVRPAPGQAGV